MSKLIELTIDNQPVAVPAGATLREAALSLGIATPTLCHYPGLATGSNCRLCVVEVHGARALVPACSRPAEAGMQVTTDSERVRRARRTVLELLLGETDTTRAPELLAYARYYGAKDDRWPGDPAGRRALPVVADNPFFVRDYAKCILCRRCTEACGEGMQRTFAIAVTGRGSATGIGTGGTGRLTDSPCVFCGNCVGVCPTGALLSLPEHAARAAGAAATERLDWHPAKGFGAAAAAPPAVRTTCAYCGVGCTVELHTHNGRILKAAAPPAVGVNRGSLCVKGRFGHDFVHHLDRLTTPLVRKDGALTPATWDEALDRVAAELTRIRARYGADALAGLASAKCTNEENYLLQKFMRTVIGTHNVDHCARLCHASSVAAVSRALGSTAMSNSIGELRHDIDCLLVTGSNTTENHPVIALEMKAAIARGARLILVEPRRIELAGLSTYWLRQRPGSDVAVFNGMARVIINEGLADAEFIARRTEGFAELRAAVQPFTPARVAELSGVDPDDLVAAARLYATSRAAGIFWGMGISQHRNGTDAALTLCNLALLTGQIGRPGTGLNPLRGQNNVQGASDMGCLPNLLPGYVPVGERTGHARLAELWGVALPAERGLTATEVTEAMGGQIKGLYVMGENPLLTDPNLNHARECFARLEFLVVQDIFLSETAAIADVVLPALSFAEKDGTFTNTERRVQRVRRVRDGPGQSRADHGILCALARRLGAAWQYDSAAAIFAEIRQAVPDYAGISYDRIEQEGLCWPCPSDDHPGTPYLFAASFPRGRGRLHPVPLIAAAELPDADYPLCLTTGRVLYHWHGGVLSRRSAGLDAICPEAMVELNPADAAALGVTDGQMVRVRSRRGEVTARADLTARVDQGTVFMTFHFSEAAANLLTIDALDPIAKIPEFKVCAVRVEPLDQPG